MKIVSPDILHKTEAGGVMVGVQTAADVERNYATILANARKYNPMPKSKAFRSSKMLPGARKSSSAPSLTGHSANWWPLALRCAGRGSERHHLPLAPATKPDALSMLDGIQAMKCSRACAAAIRPTARRSPISSSMSRG